jgi:hypothetical protein
LGGVLGHSPKESASGVDISLYGERPEILPKQGAGAPAFDTFWAFSAAIDSVIGA